MPVQVYRPDPAMIAELARKARCSISRQGGDGEGGYNFGNLRDGDTILRVLPAVTSHGVPAKRVFVHDFSFTPLRDIVSKKTHRCITRTYPTTEGLVCPFDMLGDKIKATCPTATVSGWHSPRWFDYVQAVDREENPPVARIFRFTSTVANDFWINYDRALQRGVDITDTNMGMDIVVNRSKQRRRGGGEQVTYKLDLYSLTGPTPLSAADSLQSILDGMVNLERVFQLPGDDKIVEMQEDAAKVENFYMRQALSQRSVQVQVPVSIPAQQAAQYQISGQGSLTNHTLPAQNATALICSDAQTQVSTTSHPTQAPVAQEHAVQQGLKQPSLPAMQQISVPHSSQKAEVHKGVEEIQRSARTPMAAPSCFAKQGPKKDGTIGYDFASAECLVCPFDAQCSDAEKSLGNG